MIKKLLSITAASVVAVFATTAQTTIPNANMEAWAGNEPTDWTTLNNIAPPLTTGSCVKATNAADIHGGTAAMILTTKSLGLTMIPGTAATKATVVLSPPSMTGGIDFTGRPDSLTGWYKYVPTGNDAGNIVGILFDANRDTVAIAPFFPSGTVSTYTRFKVAFNYVSANVVDSALFIAASSGETGAQTGSKLYIDDLGLVYNPSVGVNDLSTQDKISVYPNPVSDNLFINMAGVQDASVTIFDITGKKVSQQVLTEKVNTINIATLAKGMYVYQISTAAKAGLKTGKFIVK